MAVYQPAYWPLTHRYRGQAPSHTGCANQLRLGGAGKSGPRPWHTSKVRNRSNVGGGLPPMAVYQPAYWPLTHRYRGQAPSHIGCANQAWVMLARALCSFL